MEKNCLVKFKKENETFFKAIKSWKATKFQKIEIFFFHAEFIEKRHSVKFEKENEEFFDYKTIDLKRLQNLHFFKGVSRWFLFKN